MGTPRSRRRQRLDRRGRAALGWGLLFFVGSQLALIAAMERWRPELLHPEFGFRWTQLQKQLADHPGRPLALVLGSSHTATGFLPEDLDPAPLADGQTPLVFNFSMTGAGPVLQLTLLRRLLDAGVTPHWVVLEAMAPFFHAEGKHAEVRRVNVQCLKWGDLATLRHYTDRPARLYRRWLTARLEAWYANRYCLMNCLAPRWLPAAVRQDWWHDVRPLGSLPLPGRPVPPEELRAATDYARREYAPAFRDFRITPAQDRAARELLETCRARGIRVALVRMPEGSEFRSWYPPEARAPMDRYFAGLAREYDAPVFDARTWVPDDGFRDAHHLLPGGALAFTKRLEREALRPFLEGAVDPGRQTLSAAR